MGLGKNSWPLAAIRQMADAFLAVADGRKKSPAYEIRWLNLAGSCAPARRLDHHRYEHHLWVFRIHVHPFHTPARKSVPRRLRGGSKWSALLLRGLTIQKIEGLFVADSCPDSIQAPIPCQTSAYSFRRLF